MRSHVDSLGWGFILYGALQLAAAVIAAVLCLAVAGMFVAGGLERDDDGMLVAGAFYGGLGLVAVVFAAVLAVPNVLVGAGLRQRRRWSRLGGLVCAALALSALPIGTVLGIWALKVLLDPDVTTEFEG